MRTEGDVHMLNTALELFRHEEMTISRMRDCIKAWLNGVDFTSEDPLDDEVVYRRAAETARLVRMYRGEEDGP